MGETLGYARVSTAQQNPARQLEALRGVDQLFLDEASGAAVARPELDKLTDYARRGDVVRVKSPDRLARSTMELLTIIGRFRDKGVAVEFVDNPELSTDTPHGEFTLTILAAVAQLERATIRERQLEGIALAKERGVYKGRKPAFNAEQAAELVARLDAGVGVSQLAREYGVSRQTVYNVRARAVSSP
jgi:DNA invertase Pin-like site-specific DNA recombinase